MFMTADNITEQRFPWNILVIIVGVALVGRVALLVADVVTFHSDEAVIGLMARHILQGARPTFFYGQAYMGSLDAFLVAGGFSIFGESVLTIRIVQSVLYLLVVATGFAAAWRLSGRVFIASIAALALAIPPTVVTLYTTATLGGYNEVMLFGNVLILLGYEVTHGHEQSRWRWALLGAVAGLGWWTNGLIIAYLLPVGLLGLRRAAQRQIPYYVLGAAFFIAFSSPWWIFDLNNDGAARDVYLASVESGEFGGVSVPLWQRAVGLMLIGLPTTIGMRFPWEGTQFFLLPVGLVILAIYIIALYRMARGESMLRPDARGFVLAMIGLFCIIFVASSFGADATGRYFLPLALPLGIVLGTFAESLRRASNRLWLVYGVVAVVIGYYAIGQYAAATSDKQLTTQFTEESHITNTFDDELIAFLDAHNIAYGYTSYWVAFRLTFLSEERLQFDPTLPAKSSLQYEPDTNRFPAYADAAANADSIAYITTNNVPQLSRLLEAEFAQQGVTYEETTIGPYHVYYDFMPQRPVVDFAALAEMVEQ